MKFSYLVLFLLVSVIVQAQEKQNEPVEIESLKDAECLTAVLGMEGYLYKTDLNKPNTPENFYYGIDLKGVDEKYPYLVEVTDKGKEIKYDRLVPILVEAIEESNERLNEEIAVRTKLEDDFANYKITMENHLRQMQYQIDLLNSEVSGINESKPTNQ